MSRDRRYRWFAPVAVLAAVALAACGGSTSSTRSSSKSPPTVNGVGASKLIAAAPDKTAAAKTAKMSGKISVASDGKTQTIPIEGALDLQNGALELSLEFGSLGLPAGASGGKVEARLVDGVMYLDLGALADAGGGPNPLAEQLGGKPWLKLDLASVAGSMGTTAGLDNLSSVNPSGTLDGLRGAGDVEKIGTEDLRGVATTHYRVTIDPGKALEQAPAALRDKVRSSLDLFSGPIPAEVWIDGDGLARKMSLDVDTPRGRVSETFELYDFGSKVDVSAPPADEVTDFSALVGGLLDGLRSGLAAPSGSA